MISVIVPVYNVEMYLDKCIKSITEQTYKDLEIILVDDGSTDHSLEICKKWASFDDRIIVLHKENGGVSSARNLGLDIASGEYVAFVDSDDWIEPNMYEEMLNNAIDNNADCVFCGYNIAYETGEVVTVQPMNSGLVGRREALEQLLMAIKDSQGYNGFPFNKLTRREIAVNQRFDTKFVLCEDVLYFTDVLFECKNVFLNPYSYYNYYQREGSACHSINDHITRQNIDNILARQALLEKINSYPKLKKYVKAYTFSVGIKTLCKAYILRDDSLSRSTRKIVYKSYFGYIFYSKASFKRKIFCSILFLCIVICLPRKILSALFNMDVNN